MAIGYACKLMGVPGTRLKGMVLKKADEKLIAGTIAYNLSTLGNMLDYNMSKDIRLFRISSDIIPFGSHAVNTLEWWKDFEMELAGLGSRIKSSGMRVSMHPGQYTVLNSPDEAVVDRCLADLVYHTRFLDALGVDSSNKIILHVGGLYGDRDSALKRFESNWQGLPDQVKRRLVVENDEKCFNISEVLQLGSRLGIPVVYDNLHSSINPPATGNVDHAGWIRSCRQTWKPEDGRQKIHYSQQSEKGQRGAHSDTIHIRQFMHFYNDIRELDPDIMLEVKDKNISALKCINCTTDDLKKVTLEKEWASWKYAVMERSYKLYKEIGGMFRGTETPDAVRFYERVEEAGAMEYDIGSAINTVEHVWGYFKNKAGESERKRYLKLLGEAGNDINKIIILKRFLLRLAEKYDEKYLIGAYYFMEV
ncbi:MAG: UV DNA damage repair endonuclease UvsE [Pseudomonadota bacterium]